jgi:ABC-type multidrug transport system ATPase subunit
LATIAVEKKVKTASKPVKVTFENLEFEVNLVLSKEEAQKSGKKLTRQKIIKGVSGYALPGESLYIMGASGAGKTSLLNMLSDRISTKNG